MTNLQDATEHIGEVLKRVKKEHLQRAYKIDDWYYTFLTLIGLNICNFSHCVVNLILSQG